MPSGTNLRADLLRCFAEESLDELLEATPRRNRLRLLHDFTLWGREAQFEPESADWRLWLVLGGRGAGKSRTGAEWIIRRFEGFRSLAYRDAAGIWTIGFGHTSAAGAPHVRPGMKISRKEGLQILARDVASFARGVEHLLEVDLDPCQFSALVSFAYNVGLENFRRSSVLRAVNARDFAAVPRRLALWVKCKGRVLPGLVNRRAAEAAMFLSEEQPRAREPMRPARDEVEPLAGKPLCKSSTGIAALLSGAAGIASSFSASLGELTHVASSPLFPLLLGLLILAAVVWIIRERRLKALEDGV